MKKLIVIIGIGLALCAIASTQTSKEYVDRRDNEILSHAKEYTDDSVSGLAHEEDIPTKVSQLQNDTGYVTSSATNGLVERANSYADEKSRQTLLAAKQYTDNATNGQSKVMSVNGRTGNVVLSSVDVHARPDNWMPSSEDVGAQPTLVSGTNIKTVNGNSLLGSGNIEIQGGGVVDTNAVRDIIRETVDGAARPLPRYLHALDFDDSYPDAAEEYYRSRGNGKVDGGCSSVRDGGFLYRNFDYPFDDRAEFVVKMSAGPGRFASVGVAQVGTNLTEEIVTSGKPEYSRLYKWLPGATVDGINENGVACNINVVDGAPAWHTEPTVTPLHPLAAIRWILDNATNAQHAAEYIAANIRFPQGWTQNFHYMVADERETWIVEDGHAVKAIPIGDLDRLPSITNFKVIRFQNGEWIYNPIMSHFYNPDGEGWERWGLLQAQSITNVWYTRAYRRETNPPWVSDLREVLDYTNDILNAWATHPKEYFRGRTANGHPWWQTVHTSVYDLTNRVLRVSVQETDDWYTFQVPASGAKIDAYTKAETDGLLAGKADGYFEEDIPGKIAVILDDGITVGRSEYDIDDTVQRITDAETAIEGDSERITAVMYRVEEVAVNAANKVSDPTAGNIASLTADGDLADGGKTVDDFIMKEYDTGLLPATLSAGWDAELGGFSFYSDGDRAFTVFPFAKIIKGWYGGWSWITNEDDENIQDALDAKADRSMISATNETFAAEVLAVQVASLSTNITAEVYIAATNACANLGIDPALIPQGGTLGTVGGLLVALAAAVALLSKKTKLLKSDGTAEDDFATDIIGKPVAKTALMIPLEAKTDSFTAEDGHAYAVTMTGTVTITMPTVTEGKAAIFQARFSAAAQQSVQFSTDAVIKFDGADCGVVKAGKDALLSAMWNGTAWDLVWKNQA